MEHFAPLRRLPDNLKFPADYKDRIRFDAVHHTLVFNGFMRKVDYDTLSRLSSDLAYLDALQELFSQGEMATSHQPRWRNLVFIAGGLVLIALILTFWFWPARVQPTKTLYDGADIPKTSNR